MLPSELPCTTREDTAAAGIQRPQRTRKPHLGLAVLISPKTLAWSPGAWFAPKLAMSRLLTLLLAASVACLCFTAVTAQEGERRAVRPQRTVPDVSVAAFRWLHTRGITRSAAYRAPLRRLAHAL